MIKRFDQKAKIRPLMLLLATFMVGACEKVQTAPEQSRNIAVASVAIDEPMPTITLAVAASRPLHATVSPEDATNQQIVWSSDDETIATISPEGILTAVKAGNTTIWARSKELETISDQRTVVVETPTVEVDRVALDTEKLTIEIGQTKPLTVTIAPENATNRGVTWVSSDTSVATVSKTGSVSGLKVGKTTITVTSDADTEKSATCEVTVTEQSIPATDMWMKTTKLELKTGESKPLHAVTIPTNATDQTMVWSSDDETIATVDANGSVAGIRAGVTIVWAKWGGDTSIKDKCTVTVLGSSSYAVGDPYPDADAPIGIVFWKDPTNPAKGKIVSLTETAVEWGSDQVKRNTSNEHEGQKNMEIIRAIPGWEQLYPAFKWCAELGTGWYLPALSEMKAIYDAKDKVNATIAKTTAPQAAELDYNKDYWTSTERAISPESYAVMIQFYEGFGGGGAPAGGTSFASKSSINNTRAIRQF